MKFAYEALLRLYPKPHREAFGPEMASVFAQAAGDCRSWGLTARAAFLWNELSGLIAGAFSAWLSVWHVLRYSKRRTLPFAVSLTAGAAIAALCQRWFYSQTGQRVISGRGHPGRAVPAALQAGPDLVVILLLAGGALLFVSVFCTAFVWNIRMIRTRARGPALTHVRKARR
jgi:hypothetical protein